MTASIEFLTYSRALGVVIPKQRKGFAGEAPITMVLNDQSPDGICGVRENDVAGPSWAVRIYAATSPRDIVHNTATRQQPRSIGRGHQQMSSFGQLKIRFAGCEKRRFIFSNSAGNVDDYVGCSFDVHFNSSIHGGIYSFLHPQFTGVVCGASELIECQSDQSNSPEPDRFNESERFCSDCAWPVACRELGICQRRDLGDIRSRCPWAPSQVFQ